MKKISVSSKINEELKKELDNYCNDMNVNISDAILSSIKIQLSAWNIYKNESEYSNHKFNPENYVIVNHLIVKKIIENSKE